MDRKKKRSGHLWWTFAYERRYFFAWYDILPDFLISKRYLCLQMLTCTPKTVFFSSRHLLLPFGFAVQYDLAALIN